MVLKLQVKRFLKAIIHKTFDSKKLNVSVVKPIPMSLPEQKWKYYDICEDKNIIDELYRSFECIIYYTSKLSLPYIIFISLATVNGTKNNKYKKFVYKNRSCIIIIHA